MDCKWLWEEGEEEQPVISPSAVVEAEGEPQFVIEDEEEEDAEQSVPVTPSPGEAGAATQNTPPKKRVPSLMARFLSALVDSLFHVGFTLPVDAAESATDRTSYLIW